WHFGDGATSTLQHPVHTYTQNGAYDVRLTVTGANGVSVVQKPAFVRVGHFSSIAMICGTSPPNPADAAIADHLRGLGFTVTTYDDEPANRPTTASLVNTYDLIIVSST